MPAVALDAEQLGVTCVRVDRRDDMADRDGELVVRASVRGAVACVEPVQDLEHGRRRVQERAGAGGEARVADVGRRGLQQRYVETGRERLDQSPELVVGGEAVEVDERAREVVGLDDDVVGCLVGLAIG